MKTQNKCGVTCCKTEKIWLFCSAETIDASSTRSTHGTVFHGFLGKIVVSCSVLILKLTKSQNLESVSQKISEIIFITKSSHVTSHDL